MSAKNLDLPDKFFEAPQGLAIEVFEYDDYLSKAMEGAISTALVLYPDLLHGSRPE